MANYKQLRQDVIDLINLGAPDEEVDAYISSRGYSPKEFAQASENYGTLTSAIKRGGKGIGMLLGDIAPAMAGYVGEQIGIPGAKAYKERQMAEAAATQQEMEKFLPAQYESYEDVKRLRDVPGYALEALGEGLPSMIPSVFTGGAAGILGRGAVAKAGQIASDRAKKAALAAATPEELVSGYAQGAASNLARTAARDAMAKKALQYEAMGAFAGSGALNVPEAFQSIYSETGQMQLLPAIAAGGFNAVLDAITPISLLRSAKGKGLTGNDIVGAWYARGAKEFGKGFLTEGATESIQEMTNAAAVKFVDENKEFFTPENLVRFIDAGLKGGIAGGGIQGAFGAAFGKQAEPEAAPLPPTQGPGPLTPAQANATPIVAETPVTPLKTTGEAGPLPSAARDLAGVVPAGQLPEDVSKMRPIIGPNGTVIGYEPAPPAMLQRELTGQQLHLQPTEGDLFADQPMAQPETKAEPTQPTPVTKPEPIGTTVQDVVTAAKQDPTASKILKGNNVASAKVVAERIQGLMPSPDADPVEAMERLYQEDKTGKYPAGKKALSDAQRELLETTYRRITGRDIEDAIKERAFMGAQQGELFGGQDGTTEGGTQPIAGTAPGDVGVPGGGLGAPGAPETPSGVGVAGGQPDIGGPAGGATTPPVAVNPEDAWNAHKNDDHPAYTELSPEEKTAWDRLAAAGRGNAVNFQDIVGDYTRRIEATRKKTAEEIKQIFTEEKKQTTKGIEDEIAGLDYNGLLNYMLTNGPESIQGVMHKVADAVKRMKAMGYTFSFDLSQSPQQSKLLGLSGNSMRGAAGHVMPRGKHMELVIAGRNSGRPFGANFETVAHELLHSVTIPLIRYGEQNPNTPEGKIVQELKDLSAHVKKELRKRERMGTATQAELYYLHNTNAFGKQVKYLGTIHIADEIMSQGNTGSDFRHILETIEYKGKSVIDAFVEMVRKLIGLSPKEETALSEIIRLSNRLFEAKIPMPTSAYGKKVSDVVGSERSVPWSERDVPNQFGREEALTNLYKKAEEAYFSAMSPDEAYDLLYEESIPGERSVLRQLKKENFLGFDYPHQAIEAILQEPESFDLSSPLKAAISRIGNKIAEPATNKSSEFSMDDLPHRRENQDFIIKEGTNLYHGAHLDRAHGIDENGRVLKARPGVKSGGGMLTEGNLIWFGDKQLASGHSKSEVDTNAARYDEEEGIRRLPGKVFQTTTDKDYKLIHRERVLTEEEAQALNTALGIPDYVSLRAGDTTANAAYRAHMNSQTVPKYEIPGKGKMSSPWPIILQTLGGYDGYYDNTGIALAAENAIQLSGDDTAMRVSSERFDDALLRPSTDWQSINNTNPDSDIYPEAKPATKEQVKDFFNAVDKLPTTEDIEDLESEWAGGVGDFGNKDAAYGARWVNGYTKYRNALEDLLRSKFGDFVTVYRLMTPEGYEKFKSGELAENQEPIAFTLNKQFADNFRNFAAWDEIKPNDFILVEAQVPVESIWMLGHRGESELVLKADDMADGRYREIPSEINKLSAEINNAVSNIATPAPAPGPSVVPAPGQPYTLPKLTKLQQPVSTAQQAKNVAKKVTNAWNSDDFWTKFRIAAVDPTAGLAKTLSSLPEFQNGKLRADMLIRSFNQVINLIKNGLQTGIPVINDDGSVIIQRDANNMARSVKLADELDNNPVVKGSGWSGRGYIGEIARILRGREIQEEDARLRAKAEKMMIEARTKMALARQARAGGASLTDITKLVNEAKALRKEANKFKNINREKQVTQAHIDWAEAQLKAVPQVQEVFDIWRAVNMSLIDLWENAGLLTKREADNYRQKTSYVPLYAAREDLAADEQEAYTGQRTGTKTVRMLEHLDGADIQRNIWENMDKHYASMVAAAYQNQTRKIAVDQLRALGAAKISTTSDNPDVNLRYKDPSNPNADNNGVVHVILDNPNDLAAFQMMHYELGPLMKGLSATTQMLRATALINPMYWLKQLIRDPIHASIVARSGIVTPFHAFKEYVNILANNSEEARLLASRGVIGQVDSTIDLAEYLKQVGTEKITPSALDKMMHKVMQMHEASDAATRVAIYKKSKAEGLAQGMSEKEATDYAVFRAREAINFAVRGNSKTLNALRHMIPFFSAAITSLDTLYRAATGYGLNPAEKKKAQELFRKRAAMMVVLSTAYAMMLQDDDDYKKLPDNVKDNNWLFPNPFGGGHSFIKIPVPFEVGFLFKTVPEAAVRYMAGTSTGKEVLGSYALALQRNLPGEGILIPQAAKPALEAITNYSFFTGRPIEGMSDQGLPVAMRGPNASEVAKIASKFGLDKVGISPAKFDHLMQGYMAELGTFTTGTASAAIAAATGKEGPAKNIEQMPFFKSFMTNPNTSKAATDFYDIMHNAQETVNAFNRMKKEGRIQEAKEFMGDEEKRKLAAVAPTMRKIQENMAKIRQRVNQIEASKGMDAETKRVQINKLMEMYDRVAQQGYRVAERAGISR